MNAPWNVGGHPGRDPFGAYLCDDASLTVVREVATDLSWQAGRCNKGGLPAAVQSLSMLASPDILLVDLSESGDPLRDLDALAEVCEPGTTVLAVGQVNDVRLYRELLDRGIQDYLLKPVSADALHQAILQAQVAGLAPRSVEAGSVRRHICAAVIGSRGGVGGSTIATSLAWSLSTDAAMSTALLDLDMHFGTGALSLDLEPGRGLIDAIDDPDRIDGLFIERAMIRASDKLAILSAEAPLGVPFHAEGAAFQQLQEELRHSFEACVIDLPRILLIARPGLVSGVDVVVLVADQTLAAARDAIRILAWLKGNAPHTPVLIVANKVPVSTPELSIADLEASIERPVSVAIPHDAKAAVRAAKLGRTFVDANRDTKAGQAMADLATQVQQAVGTAPLRKSKPSLRDKFDLRALFTRREKAHQAAQ